MKKKYDFLIYARIIFGIMIVSASPICALESLKHSQDYFHEDLEFIQKTLFENHPGIHNALDPTFSETFEKKFKIAEQKLSSAISDEEKARILQKLGSSFHDSHCWISYGFKKIEASATCTARSFGIQELKKGICWINLPNFCPSKDQIKVLNQIIESLPQLRKQTVVFDLRGNGGGNSLWGKELLEALFGKVYARQRLAESRCNVYVEWRVSEGNLEWVKNGLIPMVKEQFTDSHPAIQQMENVCEGIKNAFLQEKKYYREDLGQPIVALNAINEFNGRIFAIIDERCGSACLGFIDGLKAMNAGVILIGKTTRADSLYMELRTVSLPSGKGTLGFPIKVFRNRLRGHNIPYIPDIQYNDGLQNTTELQEFVLEYLEKVKES